jgi:hypothetical protein
MAISPSNHSTRKLADQILAKPSLDWTRQIAECPCAPDIKAGMYLLNGDWKLAHETSQDLHTAIGAHWHALVHRHEPDYQNSKYWLRRTGASPVYTRLVEASVEAGREAEVAPQGSWDPVRFTDCFSDPANQSWTLYLDRLELQLLLDHCLEEFS